MVGGVEMPLFSGEQSEQIQEMNLGKEIEKAQLLAEAEREDKSMPAADLQQVLASIESKGEIPMPDVNLAPSDRQAILQAALRDGASAWKTVTSKGNVWRVHPGSGSAELLVSAPPDQARDLPADQIQQFVDMKSMYRDTVDLAKLPNDPMYEAVGWAPNIIRNMLIDEDTKKKPTAEKAEKFFQSYQSYQPEYFMYAARMLKAIQGSRPSDFDMIIYLENLPKISDNDETKIKKLTKLSKQLVDKFNDKRTGFLDNNYRVGFDAMQVPTQEQITAWVAATPPPRQLSIEELAALAAEG
jgi:hypothetical protein